MVGDRAALFPVGSVTVRSGKPRGYSFRVTVPLDADRDGRNDVWAWGNFVKLSLANPGEGRAVEIEQVSFRQDTRVLQRGLRGTVEEVARRTGGQPIPQPARGDFNVAGNGDLRASFRFDLSPLGAGVRTARFAFLNSRFSTFEDYKHLGLLPTAAVYRADGATPEGEALDSVRIECSSLWTYLDVTAAVKEALARGEREVSLVLTFHEDGYPEDPGLTSGFAFFNGEAPRVRWRPKLVVEGGEEGRPGGGTLTAPLVHATGLPVEQPP